MKWAWVWVALGSMMALLAIANAAVGDWHDVLHLGGVALTDFYVAMLLTDIERLRVLAARGWR